MSEYAKTMLAGYDKWLKSKQGKEYQKKAKKWKPVEIKSLPVGWELTDGGVKDGFFNYSYDDIELSVEASFKLPIWAGGYPTQHYTTVTKRDYDDDDPRGRELAKFSVHKLGWDEAWKQANKRALEIMKSYEG